MSVLIFGTVLFIIMLAAVYVGLQMYAARKVGLPLEDYKIRDTTTWLLDRKVDYDVNEYFHPDGNLACYLKRIDTHNFLVKYNNKTLNTDRDTVLKIIDDIIEKNIEMHPGKYLRVKFSFSYKVKRKM